MKCEICKEEIEGKVFLLDDINCCEFCYHESLDNDDCQYDQNRQEEDDLAKFKEEKTKEDYQDEEYHRQKEDIN